MPISDEVIELAPVKNTKKKLIVMFVIMGVLLAAAVAFLVLYLLKPAPPPDTSSVRAVAVTENGLFSTVENAEQKSYASIGNSYTIKVSVSADADANTDIAWYVEPSSALNVTSTVTSGEPSITFTPNAGFHGQEVTVTARALGNGNISQVIKFTVVNQGTESIVPTKYYRGTEVSNAVTLTAVEPDIKIPYYSADTNNKQYTLLVDQYGMYDESTNTHLPISVLQNSNILSAKAGDSTIISVTSATANGIYFRALKSGTTTLTITANSQHDNATEISKTVKVVVSSSADLGYIENIYFFDKAIVDEEFIGSYLRGDDINMTALTADYKANTPNAKTGATMNPASITFPYNLKYEDIFKHVLITPVKVQYDTAKKTLNTDWYSRIKVESSDSAVLNVEQNARTGATSILARGLASTVTGATSCKLSFTDKTDGSLRAGVDTAVNVVANNSRAGRLVVIGDKTNTPITETTPPISIVPSGTSTIAVEYNLEMPGKTDVKTVIENGYMTAGFIINYNAKAMTIKLADSETALEPGKTATFTEGSFALTAEGTETISRRTFTGVGTLNVEFKSDAEDGEYEIEIIKLGTYLSATPDYAGKDNGNPEWTRSMKYKVVRQATKALFVSDEEAKRIVTGGNRYVGKFVKSTDGKSADVYIQNLGSGEVFTTFPLKELAMSDVLDYDVSVELGTISSPLTRASASSIEFMSNVISESTSSITLRVSPAGSTRVVDTLRITIHVIDAIMGFSTIDSDSCSYGKTDFGNDIYINGADVKATYLLNGTMPFTYNRAVLYYGSTIDEEFMLRRADVTGSEYEYYYDYKDAGGETKSDKLFTYNSSQRLLKPAADLYELSVKHGRDFSHIMVQFLINPKTDFYTGDSEPFAIKNCTFERKADGFKLFSANEYTEENEYPITASALTHKFNHDESAQLYASSTVDITVNGERTMYATEGAGLRIAVSYAYFMFENGTNVAINNGVPAENVSDGYRSVVFVPKVREGNTSTEYRLTVYYTQTNSTTVTWTVQNNARAVTAIEVFEDEACSTEFANGSKITFGQKDEEVSNYTKTLYIRAKYAPYDGQVTYFQNISLIVPSYLKYNTLTTAGPYRLAPSEAINASDDDSDYYTVLYTCTFALNSEKYTSYNVEPNITVATSQGEFAHTFGTEVKAGLQYITVDGKQVGAGGTGNAELVFNVSDPTSTATQNFALTYTALGAEYNIGYKHTDITVSCICLDGLKFNDAVNAESPSIGFTLVPSALKAYNGSKLTVTFTDAVSEKTFTVEFSVTVNIDVYAMAFGGDSVFSIVTTRNDRVESQTKDIVIVFNGGDENRQPTDANILKTDIQVIIKDGDTDTAYLGSDVTVDGEGDSATLVVNNALAVGNNYCVRISHPNVNNGKYIYKYIVITTTAHSAELVYEESDNFTVSKTSTVGEGKTTTTSYEANVVLNAANKEFNMYTAILNDGTHTENTALAPDSVTVIEDGSAATWVSVSGGKIAFAPTKPNGVVQYRAQYTDSASGNIYVVNVTINYVVAVTGIELDIDDAAVYDVATETVTLYYAPTGHTYIDLSKYLLATCDFDIDIDESDVTWSLRTQNVRTDGLKVYGSVLSMPTLTLTATFNGTKVSKEYSLKVLPLPTLELTSTSGSVNMIDNEAVTVAPRTVEQLDGFTAAYTLTAANSLINIAGAGESKSVNVKLTAQSKASEIEGDYTLTAAVKYTLTGSTVSVLGELISNETYTLTVVCDYAPDFKLTCDGDEIRVYDSSMITHTIKESASYKLEVLDALSNAANAAVASAVVTVDAFTGDSAVVRLKVNESGQFTVTYTATVYGKKFEVRKQYSFMYNYDPTAKLYISSDGGANYTPFNDAQKAIDFTATAYVFKYEISGINYNYLKNDDIVVGGSVLKGTLVKVDDTTGYVTITASAATVLNVYANITVGTRTVYLPRYTVELTATPPTIGVTSTQDMILPAGETALGVSVAEDAFKGTVTVNKFEIIEGGAYANIVKSGDNYKLVANSDIAVNRSVTVLATVTVSGGVYNGKTYTAEKVISIKGVPVPTVEWNARGPVKLASGESFNTNDYDLVKSSDYADGTVTVDVTLDTTLTRDVHYTMDGGMLKAVETADMIKAGGKVTVTVSLTLTGIHSGTVVRKSIDVYFLPRVNDKTVTISNAVGAYDITAAADVFRSSDASAVGEGYGVTVLSASLANSADSVFASISGTMLNINNAVTENKTVKLNVSVLITGDGVYAGSVVTGTVTVNIVAPAIVSSGLNVTWNDTAKQYDEVTVANLITVGGRTLGTTEIAAVTAIPDTSDNVSVVGTGASTKIAIGKQFNVSTVSGASAKTLGVDCTVTTTDGKKYFAHVTLSVSALTVDVVAKNAGVTVSEGGSLNINTGETFYIDLTEANALDIVITAVTVRDGSTVVSDSYISYEAGVTSVRFAAADVTTLVSRNIEISYTVAGKSASLTFSVSVQPPASTLAYRADNLSNIDFVKGSGNKQVVSTWTADDSPYKYPTTLTVAASSALNNYVTKITLSYTYTNGYGTTANYSKDATITGSSHRFDFDTGWSGRYAVTSFKLTFTFKTGAAIDLCNISTSLVVYNAASRGSSQTVPIQYSLRVLEQYSVTFNANGGTFGASGTSSVYAYTSGERLGEHWPTPTYSGKIFAGWYTDAVGGTQVSGEKVVDSTATYYAHWIDRTYTVTFKLNATDTTPYAVVTVTNGGSYGTVPNPTVAGKTFAGWYDNSSKTLVDLTRPVALTADATFVASWSDVTAFIVTFNDNGATTTRTYYTGDTYGVLPTAADGEGYTFIGWYTSATGGTRVNGSEEVTATTTLYARRTPNIYTITLNGNGGTSFTLYGAYNSTLDLSKYVSVREGYTFDGWYADSAASAATEITVSGDVTLKASWTARTQYTVTFNDNGTSSTRTYYAGEVYGALPTAEDVEGYTFVGWYTDATGGTRINGSEEVTTGTLYARRTPNVYTITLDGGAGTSFTLYGAYDTTIDLTKYVSVREGYTFDGWFVSGAETATSSVKVEDDVTLSAHWTERTKVAVTFKNGAETVDTVEYYAGEKYGALPTATKTGHTFIGWFTDADEQITGSEEVEGDIELYAQFVANTYTVTLNCGDGAINGKKSITISATYNSEVDLAYYVPEYEGNTFDGWCVDGASEKVTKVTVTDNVTLVANWTPDETEITE